MSDDAPACQATRYGESRECLGPVKFRVVYSSRDGRVLDEHPACFRHGMAEVDRHYASAGMATCELMDRSE